MADPRTASRAERLLDLLSFFLAEDRAMGWPEIREAFPQAYKTGSEENALRKFERDKAELVELGVPLEWTPREGEGRGGYRLDRDQYYLRDLRLSEEERTLLSLAGAAALEQPAFPLREELSRALDKLFFSSSLSSPSPLLRGALEPGRGRGESAHLERLGHATAARRDVEIAYRAYSGAASQRRVSPYGLAFRGGAWFLVGFCHLRQATRTFAVERIASVEEVAGSTRRGPDFEVPGGFDLRAHVGLEAWELGLHPQKEVRLSFAKEVAPLVQNTLANETFTEGADGSWEGTIAVTNEDAIVRLVLRLAPHASIRSPASLQEKLRGAAASIAARHVGAASVPVVAAPADSGSEGEGSDGKARKRRPDVRERLQRALLLIPKAVAMSGSTVEALAAETRLGVDELVAELDFLRLVGRPPFSPAELVDIDVVDGRVYATLPQGFAKPPALTPFEGAALDAAASALVEEGGPRLQQVREKIRSAIAPAARARFDELAGRFQVAAFGLPPGVAVAIDRGIEERRELSFRYFSAARGEASQRVVRPLRRFLHQGYWYLYAYCNERRDRRLFRLDRATELTLEDATFLPRPLEEIPFGMGGGREAKILVDEGPWAAPGYLMRLGATAVEVVEGGGALATFPMREEAYVLSVVLSLAGKGELLEPASLRPQVASLATSIE